MATNRLCAKTTITTVDAPTIGVMMSGEADRQYGDDISFRKALRAVNVRPTIKQRVVTTYDQAHNARIDDRYHQCSTSEYVNSSIKRSHDSALRARYRFGQFRELAVSAGVTTLSKQ